MVSNILKLQICKYKANLYISIAVESVELRDFAFSIFLYFRYVPTISSEYLK